MLKKLTFRFIPLLFFLLPMVVRADDLTNIAIMDLESDAVSKSEATALTNELRSQILKLDLFNIIERSQMKAILQEQGFQQSELCDNEDCLAAMGKMVGVQMILAGDIGRVGSLYMLSVRLIDVTSGKIIIDINEKHKGTIEDILLELVPKVAQIVGSEMFHIAKKSGSGLISLKGNVDGADVFINDILVGQTPLEAAHVGLGDFKIVVVKKGFEKFTTSTSIYKNNEHRDISFMMKGKSRNKAALLSLAVPGWGQYYFGYGKRAMIAAGAELALLTGALVMIPVYASSVSSYNDIHDTYLEPGGDNSHAPSTEAYDDVKSKHSMLIAFGVVAAVGWIANVADVLYLMPEPGKAVTQDDARTLRVRPRGDGLAFELSFSLEAL